MPILHRDQIRQTIADMSYSVEAYCLIAAFCAFMLIQPGIVLKTAQAVQEPTSSTTNPKMGNVLMEESVRLRKGYDYVEDPSINTIVTSFFLFGCCFGLNKHNSAWFHLREATTLAQILGMQDENSYVFDNVVETSRMRRLFWLLFVTERQVTMFKSPIVLTDNISSVLLLLPFPLIDPLLISSQFQSLCTTETSTVDPACDHQLANRRPRLVELYRWLHPSRQPISTFRRHLRWSVEQIKK